MKNIVLMIALVIVVFGGVGEVEETVASLEEKE